jgi:hypothetical protein
MCSSNATYAVVDGIPQWGVYTEPFTSVNLLDAKFPGLLGRGRGLRRSRLKEWQHFAIIHPDCYVSFALVDAKFICTSFMCFFDRASRQTVQTEKKKGPGGIALPDHLWDARFAFQTSDYFISVHNCLNERRHGVALDVMMPDGLPVKARFLIHQDTAQVEPLVAVLPFPSGRPFYTHKAPCPIEGELTVGDRKFTFDSKRDLALIDVHKAYYPYSTFWNWATFACREASGRLVALNLTHNVIENDHQYNENAAWIDGTLDRLGPARFGIPDDAMNPWEVRTLDGRVDLQFEPHGMRSETINLLAAHSSYEQPFGHYSGTIVDSHGEKVQLENVFGIAERHQVRW